MAEPRRIERFEVKRQSSRSKVGFGDFVASVDPRGALLVGLFSIVGSAIAAAAWELGLALAIVFVAAVFTAAVLGLWGLARLVGRQPTGPSSVVVGGDGLRLEYGDGTRFIPVHRLIGVSQEGTSVSVKSRGAANLSLELASEDEAEALCRRASEALVRTETSGSAEARAVVERFRGSLAERADQLAAAVGGLGDYRERRLSADDVAALIADPRVRPEHRVTAAAALKRVDASRSRIAVDDAMQACANLPLSNALDALTDGELDERLVADAEQWHRGRRQVD